MQFVTACVSTTHSCSLYQLCLCMRCRLKSIYESKRYRQCFTWLNIWYTEGRNVFKFSRLWYVQCVSLLRFAAGRRTNEQTQRTYVCNNRPHYVLTQRTAKINVVWMRNNIMSCFNNLFILWCTYIISLTVLQDTWLHHHMHIGGSYRHSM
jgi:hypothetical protein